MGVTKRIAALAALAFVSLASNTTTNAAGFHRADPKPAAAVTAPATEYHLRMHQLHTGEDIDIVYRIGNAYITSALASLNYFLRDYRTQGVSSYDPKEFDVLHAIMARLHRPNGVIDIVCGYRSPRTNEFLRARSADTGVAEHSQHILGKAIDIRIPGVSTVALRNAALALHAGGVGFYPVSQFVHVDVGPVRTWSFR
ncbi:MAG: YcbK family protein [Terracidiphilus sp.]